MAVEDRAAARLAEIAGLLGCSIGTFFRPDAGDHPSSMTDELVHLWSTIREPQARERILTIVREEADLPVRLPKAAE